ncbi:hypothetical protein NE857_05695 [Nocardiopsis exhalans]|uniref:Uncharacterized protein n=1 Tax=Nocardiopsis exhalans TaxID=163604 RepID=A0ABY5DAZ8_9ACTN|nr:hypothetical protein [Nocardiopsis exhalans]USY21135.1 hypothetical protein NE857_05695 [Nocardiopsis exhalans]
MSDSPTPSGFAGRPVTAPGAGRPEPSAAPLTYLVWAVVIIGLITTVAALVAYNDVHTTSSLRISSEMKEVQLALLREIIGWWVLFTAAYASLGVRLVRLGTTTRPGEPRALYWTLVAVAGFHVVVSGWLLNGAWGNWMDVVSFLLPALVLGVLASGGTRAALLGSADRS